MDTSALTPAHTPTPLFPRQRRDGGWYLGVVSFGHNLSDTCIADMGRGGAEAETDCKTLARHHNSHAALVEALEKAVAALRGSAGPEEISNAERDGIAALAAAKGDA